MKLVYKRHNLLELLSLLVLLLFPWLVSSLGLDFYLSFVTRLLIIGLAATSLNLILGYGGMVALGHAAFVGTGAYVVAMMLDAQWDAVWLVWPAALLLSAALAWLIGLISLRTHGVYFIMITLAFAQMVYYFFVSLRQYGGEDGFNLYERVNILGLDTDNEMVFYYVVLVVFIGLLIAFSRLVKSHFGMALIGIRENENRMQALGYPVFRLKLMAFVISGAVAGFAGALLADLNQFVSPSLLHWTQSADYIIMVLVGGLGLRYGGVLGAAIILGLEEFLRQWTEFWHLPLGLLLLFVVFVAPRGLASLQRSS